MAAKKGRGGARPGAGPKPKPPEERRRHRVLVNLTDAERRQLEKLTDSGETAAGYLRRVVIRHLAAKRRRKR